MYMSDQRKTNPTYRANLKILSRERANKDILMIAQVVCGPNKPWHGNFNFLVSLKHNCLLQEIRCQSKKIRYQLQLFRQ